jgi:hypothetical protein
MGNAPEVTLGVYAHVFEELDPTDRMGAVEAIQAARTEFDVREEYAETEDDGEAKSLEAASVNEADARIRTADPFITRVRLNAEGRQTQDERSVETADESATGSVFLFSATGRLGRPDDLLRERPEPACGGPPIEALNRQATADALLHLRHLRYAVP